MLRTKLKLLVGAMMVTGMVGGVATPGGAAVGVGASVGAFTGWAVVAPITFPISTAHDPQIGPFPKGHPVSDALSTVTKTIEGAAGQPPNSVFPKFDSPKKGVPKIFDFGTGVKNPHPKGLPNVCVALGVFTESNDLSPVKSGPKELLNGPTCSIRAGGLVLPKNGDFDPSDPLTWAQTGPWCGNSSGAGAGTFDFQPGLNTAKKSVGLTFGWISKGTMLLVIGEAKKDGAEGPFVLPVNAVVAPGNSCNDNLATVFQVTAPILVAAVGNK